MATSLEEFHKNFKTITNLETFIQLFESNYSLHTIYVTPNESLTSKDQEDKLMKGEQIEIKVLQFNKPEVIVFQGIIPESLEKLRLLLDALLVDTTMADQDKTEYLESIIDSIIILRNHHLGNPSFTGLGKIEYHVRLDDVGFRHLPGSLLNLESFWSTIEYEFNSRGQFYLELEHRVNNVLLMIKKKIKKGFKIKSDNTEMKFIIYEFVAGLIENKIIEITENDSHTLEAKLFELFNVSLPKKRSAEIYEINRKQKRHLQDLADALAQKQLY